MGRKEELDAMDEADKRKDILDSCRTHGSIRLDSRPALAFWGNAVDQLKKDGKIETEFVELYEEQYSYLEIRLK